ncbi:MAG TPA: NlpC/P60 family protein [Acidimicrobiales bacterium]
MSRSPAAGLATAAVSVVAALAVGLAVVASALAGGAAAGAGGDAGTPTTSALAAIPPDYLALYQEASQACSGLPWGVLAAIGTVESSNGQSTLPGVRSGANGAGAEGPMQFLPATFAGYDHPIASAQIPTPSPPGDPAGAQSPYNAADAIYAAARLLCANGIATHPDTAVYSYNHSAAYVAQVLALAQSYESYGPGTSSPAQLVALHTAETQLGVPYVWGGEQPGAAFDCSGLMQWAMATAGLTIPRVAQTQFDLGPKLQNAADLVPGDLVFFGSSASDVSHVGMLVSSGQMIDAPYTGVDVRFDPIPAEFGDAFGGEYLIGATSPGGGS